MNTSDNILAETYSTKQTRELNRYAEHESGNGRIYRASGELLIIKDVSRSVPLPFSESDCVRGAVVEYSTGCARRMRKYLRECNACYSHMLTLTYPEEFPCDGAISKNHLRLLLQRLSRFAKEHYPHVKHSVFWFLEFQERGAPHYHLFTNYFVGKDWLANAWYEVVGTGDPDHLKAGTRAEALRKGHKVAAMYATKYAQKQEQKAVPKGYLNVGRFWGVRGDSSRTSAECYLSRHDRGDPGNILSINTINWLVLYHLRSGTARVIVAEQGTRVIAFGKREDMCEIMGCIARMAIRRCQLVTTEYETNDYYYDNRCQQIENRDYSQNPDSINHATPLELPDMPSPMTQNLHRSKSWLALQRDSVSQLSLFPGSERLSHPYS